MFVWLFVVVVLKGDNRCFPFESSDSGVEFENTLEEGKLLCLLSALEQKNTKRGSGEFNEFEKD